MKGKTTWSSNINSGSRDPYVVNNEGAGFAFCWQGEPQINIGFDNSAAELAQVTSETTLIVIPK